MQMSEMAIEKTGAAVVRSANKTTKKAARRGERGMTTAEYAVGTVAACGFAGVLIKILTDPLVKGWLWELLKMLIEQFFHIKVS